MTCGVCIGVDDYDPPAFCTTTTPKARREHKCCECGGQIKIGEKYNKAVGKWDGVLTTFRQCWPCHEIQLVFSCGDGWYYGGLWETWADADGFSNLSVYDPCFQKLSPETRKVLTDMWWRWRVEHELVNESLPPKG